MDRAKADKLINYLLDRLSPVEMEDVERIIEEPPSPEIYLSAATIGERVDQYFREHPFAKHDDPAMDAHIREWRMTVQNAKPKNTIGPEAVKAFRRVLVEGERGL